MLSAASCAASPAVRPLLPVWPLVASALGDADVAARDEEKAAAAPGRELLAAAKHRAGAPGKAEKAGTMHGGSQ